MNLFLMLMQLMFSGIGRITSLFGLRLHLSGIQQSNKNSRGVKRRFFRKTAEGILEPMQWQDNVFITGGPAHSEYRDRLLTEIVRKVHDAGLPVIVLHNGNTRLHRTICAMPGAVPCDAAHRCYDPFRDQDAPAIARQLFNTTAIKPYNLTAASKNYIRGICSLYLKGLRQQPSLASLENCTDIGAIPARGAQALLGLLNSLSSRFSPQEQASISNLIHAGMAEETLLHSYLEDLQTQLACIVPPRGTPLPDPQFQSIFRSAVRRGILCMDVSSMTNAEMGTSLIFSEFLNPGIGAVYVVMDGLRLGDCLTLRNLLQQDKFKFCISGADISTLFTNSQPTAARQDLQADVFNPIADSCTMHIHFQQSNNGARLLENYYGTYRKMKQSTSYTHGSGHSTFSPFSGHRNVSSGVTLDEKDDAVWRIDQFTRMGYDEVKVFCRTGGTAQYFEYRMKN